MSSNDVDVDVDVGGGVDGVGGVDVRPPNNTTKKN